MINIQFTLWCMELLNVDKENNICIEMINIILRSKRSLSSSA